MKNIVLILALTAAACSPVYVDLAVDVRSDSEFSIDLKGVPPSVVSVYQSREDAVVRGLDSVSSSKMASAIAEKFEKDLSLQTGDIPVYTFSSDELDLSDVEDVKYILFNAGSDRVIVLDSLQTGEFSVQEDDSDPYFGMYRTRTLITLPFSLNVRVFSMDSLLHGTSPSELEFKVRQHLAWSVLSGERLNPDKARSSVIRSVPDAFGDMGTELAARFTPQWEEQYRTLLSYEGGEWVKACECARQFRWKEALEIWMKLSGGQNARMASYAAYDAAVACEMLGEYDLALEWLELSGQYYPCELISAERDCITRMRK